MPHNPLPDQLTIRDHFAMAALTGLLANPYKTRANEATSVYAYALADAMIAERNKNKE